MPRITFRQHLISPTVIVALMALLLVLSAIALAGGDPLVLARLGTLYSQADPGGSEGYDGQFVYYIALSPDPQAAAPHLDVPAYRYQRILLPLLARLLALGNTALIPWMIPLTGIISLTAGTWAVERLLVSFGVSRWYALVYGFWAGFTLSLVTDLAEPLAFGLVAFGLLALENDQRWWGWLAFGLGGFAKETILVFAIAALLVYAIRRRWGDCFGLAALALLPMAIFQFWLYRVFGQFGFASGGAMATPFEWIPFMGLLRIAESSLVYFLAMLLVFGLTVALPSLWGIWKSTRFWLAGEYNLYVAALLLNALVIPFTPFSTFRETGGIIRFASGLVLALLLFAGRYRMRRVLNYSAFWCVLNVFLLK